MSWSYPASHLVRPGWPPRSAMCPPTGCLTWNLRLSLSPRLRRSHGSVEAAGGGWTTRRLSGLVGELHDLRPDPDARRQVWLMAPLDTALVLGSAQSAEIASDRVSQEAVVVRRRSGGGAVMVVPDDSVWIDVVINRADPLWDDDVNRAPIWLGQVWAEALASLGLAHGEVLDRYQPGRWGRVACFASWGPGEVRVGEAKAVGISQRRTQNVAHSKLSCIDVSPARTPPTPLIHEQSDDLAEPWRGRYP